MDYVLSHIGTLLGACLFVSFCAILWWYLMDKNARLKRERAQARKAEVLKKQIESENDD